MARATAPTPCRAVGRLHFVSKLEHIGRWRQRGEQQSARAPDPDAGAIDQSDAGAERRNGLKLFLGHKPRLDLALSALYLAAQRRLPWRASISSCLEPASSAPRLRVHLAKRGVAVALVDRGGPGEGTSYGNAGIIEGNTIFPAAFPSSFADAAARIALKRAPEANYHLAFLPKVAPWLLAFRAASQPARLIETAQIMRPLLARAVAEHEALSAEAGAERYLRHTGWLKLYRSDQSFAAQARELELAARFGIANVPLDGDGGARARAVAQAGVPPRRALDRRGERQQSAGADARLRGALCRARRLVAHRRCAHAASRRRLIGASRPPRARSMPATWWSRSGRGRRIVLAPLGIKLPLAVKRGYHRHFRPQGNAALEPPGARCRERLLPGADGAGHPAHHRRRIRRARRAADAGAVRPRAAGGARIVSARRAGRAAAVDGRRGRALPIPGR